MAAYSTSRREVLKSLSTVAVAGSVLRAIPLEAAEYAHSVIEAEKADVKAGGYAPKFFPPHQYKTLQMLCETILPADADSGGAIEAGAPEFIDLLTSENPDYQLQFGGGLMWLDSTCEVFLVIAQLHIGRIFHQQDRHQVSGLRRQHVFD
jgi:hypothetical protein